MGEIVSYARGVTSRRASQSVESSGYLARPSTGVGPGVVVVHERWGLVGHVTGIADRLASAGFVALAPDLYRGRRASEPTDADRLAGSLRVSEIADDLAGAADYLVAKAGSPSALSGDQDDDRPESVPRVAAVGFGIGGSLALWSATLCEWIVAAVGFYPTMSWDGMRPRWSEYAAKSALVHCSDGDGGSGTPVVQESIRAITEAGGACAVYDYPGTDHAFFNDDQPEHYHASGASTAWARTLGFLRTAVG